MGGRVKSERRMKDKKPKGKWMIRERWNVSLHFKSRKWERGRNQISQPMSKWNGDPSPRTKRVSKHDSEGRRKIIANKMSDGRGKKTKWIEEFVYKSVTRVNITSSVVSEIFLIKNRKFDADPCAASKIQNGFVRMGGKQKIWAIVLLMVKNHKIKVCCWNEMGEWKIWQEENHSREMVSLFGTTNEFRYII